MKKEDSAENQKKYAARILNYIGIPNPTLIDIQVVKKVDSILLQREILRVLVEYEFLENANFAFKDSFSACLDYFSVSMAEIEKIFSETETLYKVMGADGIIERYSSAEKSAKEENHVPPNNKVKQEPSQQSDEGETDSEEHDICKNNSHQCDSETKPPEDNGACVVESKIDFIKAIYNRECRISYKDKSAENIANIIGLSSGAWKIVQISIGPYSIVTPLIAGPILAVPATTSALTAMMGFGPAKMAISLATIGGGIKILNLLRKYSVLNKGKNRIEISLE